MTVQSTDLIARADCLQQLRNKIHDLATEAAEVIQGTGDIFASARIGWLDHFDRALGCEPTTTMEDTIEALRQAAATVIPLGHRATV